MICQRWCMASSIGSSWVGDLWSARFDQAGVVVRVLDHSRRGLILASTVEKSSLWRHRIFMSAFKQGTGIRRSDRGSNYQGHTTSELGSLGYDDSGGECDASCPDPFVQNLFVLCHGEQVRYPDKIQSRGGAATSDQVVRPWDPPLTDRGKLQAWKVGRKTRLEGWNVTRIVTSSLLRCVQTAVEVIAGLCMLPSSVEANMSSTERQRLPYLSTSIKASVECGMAENLIRGKLGIPYPESEVADPSLLQPPWTLGLPELYSMLPPETHDSESFQPDNIKLPSTVASDVNVQNRYTSTFQRIANRYPSENIICVTDGEGVMQSVSMMWPRNEVYRVAHCRPHAWPATQFQVWPWPVWSHR